MNKCELRGGHPPQPFLLTASEFNDCTLDSAEKGGYPAWEQFLAELSQETAQGIEAVALDMGPTYQAAAREQLPKATIVFDRFHVMKLYSDVIRKVRKTEFRKADADGKEVIKGSLYLLLGNKQRLDESGMACLEELMRANQWLSTVYTLKEQLQALWSAPDEAAMRQALNQWWELARATSITPLHRYATMLESHADGHLRLRAIQAHHGVDRGRQRRYRHDPQTRWRTSGSGLFQAENPPDRSP